MSSSHGNKGEKDKDKENLDNLMFLSNAYIAQKKYAELEKLFLPLAQKGKIDAMINTGAIYRDEKDYKNAKKYYKMAMDKGSREAEAEYNTILIMEEHGL